MVAAGADAAEAGDAVAATGFFVGMDGESFDFL